MKKITKISVITLLVVLSSTFYYSCSKDRVVEKQKNSYSSADSYMDSKKQEEQTFTIDSAGSSPIVGNQGTKIYGGKDCLMFPNGDSVAYPFDVKLVELYKPKDMIYWQMPTVAGGTIMKTDGEIRVRAVKNGTDLVLKPDPCMFKIEMPNTAPQANMRVFYGFTSGSFIDWTDDPTALGVTTSASPVFTTTSYGYSAYVARLGWVNCGLKAGSATSSTFTFESSTDELDNVKIFIYIPTTKTVMQVYNYVSNAIPNATAVKIIAIAVDGSGNLYSFSQNTTISSNTTIEVTMSSTSDASLTAALDAL